MWVWTNCCEAVVHARQGVFKDRFTIYFHDVEVCFSKQNQSRPCIFAILFQQNQLQRLHKTQMQSALSKSISMPWFSKTKIPSRVTCFFEFSTFTENSCANEKKLMASFSSNFLLELDGWKESIRAVKAKLWRSFAQTKVHAWICERCNCQQQMNENKSAQKHRFTYLMVFVFWQSEVSSEQKSFSVLFQSKSAAKIWNDGNVSLSKVAS